MRLSQRGQAAIFVALMFNVLFVFFAMAINVALVVHDKINLQNAADLAAYYAAAKQAELFDAIAHENYAIRQSYKLLAWRYRVLGTMGLYQNSQVHPVWSGALNDTAFPPAMQRPSLCVTYKPTWQEVPPGENLCNRENLRIPPLPEVKVIAGFLGLNQGIALLSRQLRAKFDAQCEKHGAYNWWFAMSILHAFRLDQRDRKNVIYAIAQKMSTGANGDFIDLDGNSVMEGARRTFLKNLTWANRQSFDSGGEFRLLNSLQGIDPKQWLVEVKIVPTMYYTDVDNSPGCNASPQPVNNLPQRPGAQALLRAPWPNGLEATSLEAWRDNNFLADSDFQYSIGVEKNPWHMAYMGVKVKTRPREIFFPIGGAIEMIARSFAKPFGGRIGPWYSARWERGSQTSTGAPTDELMAPRVSGGFGSPDDPRRLPNYARYPGDTLGMGSSLALNALTGMNQLGISFDFYKNIKADMGNGSDNDILAWDGAGNSPAIRDYELSAIAPDLFDITYYSIEPNFTVNYHAKLNAARAQFNFAAPLRTDIGMNSTAKPLYSVQEQLLLAQQKNYQRPQAYYFVRDKKHLLTSWLPADGTYNYDVTASMTRFGKCDVQDDNLKFKTPGSCAAGGGRTGYSVKLVSRDALLSDQHAIGGPGAAANAILNPPKATDGW